MEGDAGAGQLNPADANKSSSTEVKAADWRNLTPEPTRLARR